MTNLDLVHDALEDIASVGSRNLKLEKLKKYLKEVPWLEETIEYALNPFKHYKTTKVKEIKAHENANAGGLFTFLNLLANQKGASKEDKNFLSSFASMSPKTVVVVNRIIKKDLRCGIQVKTAQKLIPDLPVYEVMKPFGDNPFPGKKWKVFVITSMIIPTFGHQEKI